MFYNCGFGEWRKNGEGWRENWGIAPWLLGGIDTPAFVPCLCYCFVFRSNIFRMGEHSFKGNTFIEGQHCGNGRDLNGERNYNGVGGF